MKFTAFWAHRHNVDLKDATFIIKYKYIHAPSAWERDFLKKQIDTPWEPYAVLTWKDYNWQYQDVRTPQDLNAKFCERFCTDLKNAAFYLRCSDNQTDIELKYLYLPRKLN